MKTSPLIQRLCFACPEISITLAYATVNSWYLYYLITIIKLPPLIAGAAFILGRFVDAILDPIIGTISDRLCHKYGRKYLSLIGIIPTCILFICLWILPSLADYNLTKFLISAIIFTLYTVCYTMIAVPRLALLPNIEQTSHGRTIQVAFNMTFLFLSLIIAFAGIPAIITFFDNSSTLSNTETISWIYAVIILAILIFIFYLPFLLFTPDTQNANKLKQFNITRNWKSLFSKKVILINLLFSCSVLALVVVQSILPFYLESYIELTTSQYPLVLGFVFLIVIISFPLWVFISKRIGKHNRLILGILPYVIFLILNLFAVPQSGLTYYLLICGFFAGLGISALSIFPWALMPDVVEEICLEVNRPIEGVGTAIFTFNNKFSGAVGIAITSIIIDMETKQNSDYLSGFIDFPVIYIGIGFLPLIAMCFMIILSYKIRQQY